MLKKNEKLKHFVLRLSSFLFIILVCTLLFSSNASALNGTSTSGGAGETLESMRNTQSEIFGDSIYKYYKLIRSIGLSLGVVSLSWGGFGMMGLQFLSNKDAEKRVAQGKKQVAIGLLVIGLMYLLPIVLSFAIKTFGGMAKEPPKPSSYVTLAVPYIKNTLSDIRLFLR